MTVSRRQFLAGTAVGALAAPAAAQPARLLRFVPHANLTSLDPVWTSAWITRDHGYMVYDTLYGQGADLTPKPQMAEGHVWEAEHRAITITLREGLRFHDGEPVLARDCLASLQRWARRDSFGQFVAAALDEAAAPDDRRLVLRFNRPFPFFLDSIAKTAPMFVMPERLARTDAFTQLTEVVGSGPFRFQRGEWVPGDRVVYERHAAYQPRQEPADMLAGGKAAHFDRVEWRIIPDAATAAAALQSGEVDWWEAPSFDLLPLLGRNRALRVEQVERFGSVSNLRVNHLVPPFNNPAFRRAIWLALPQADIMTAVAGADPARWTAPVGFFTPGSPLASEAGMDVLRGPRDIDAARRAIAASGYRGERLTFLHAADVGTVDAMSHVLADMFRRLGINLDHVVTDWGSVVQRRARKEPPDQGGWSAFCTNATGADGLTPPTHSLLRSNGAAAWFGWPDIPAIEDGIQKWFGAGSPAEAGAVGREIQAAAFREVPHYPLGQFRQPYAFRREITGMVPAPVPVQWNVRRT